MNVLVQNPYMKAGNTESYNETFNNPFLYTILDGQMIRKIKWTNEEVEMLKNIYIFSSKEKLLKNFPKRSLQSIRTKAFELKICKQKGYRTPPLERLPKIFLSEIEKITLATIIDAEGTISLKSNPKSLLKENPYIYIDNTNKEFMLKAKNLLKTNKKLHFRDYVGTNRKDIYALTLSNIAHIYVILKEILPYLIVKKEQAKLLKKWIEIHDKIYRKASLKENYKINKAQEISNIIHKLNRRGRH